MFDFISRKEHAKIEKYELVYHKYAEHAAAVLWYNMERTRAVLVTAIGNIRKIHEKYSKIHQDILYNYDQSQKMDCVHIKHRK